MLTFVLPRFFGGNPQGGRDEPLGRSAHSGKRSTAALDVDSEREALPRSTTIAGRPADEVLQALTSPHLESARQALAEIYEAYFTSLWHFAYRWTKSRDRAQELVHDVFLAIWTRRAALDIREDLKFYLRSAVRNRIYSEVRHASIVARLEVAVEEHGAELPAIGSVASPEAELEESEAEQLLETALASISPRDRDVLTMRWVDLMTLDEIAAELGVSKSRVRTIIARASVRIAPAFKRLKEMPLPEP